MWFKKQKKNVLVHYVNVDHVEAKDIPVFMDVVKRQLGEAPDGCYRYFIPCRAQETRVEVLYLV